MRVERNAVLQRNAATNNGECADGDVAAETRAILNDGGRVDQAHAGRFPLYASAIIAVISASATLAFATIAWQANFHTAPRLWILRM